MSKAPQKTLFRIPLFVLRYRWTGQFSEKTCAHLDQIRVTKPDADVCAECVALGDTWPALRMCMICGYIGCCDTSKNTHMRKHYQATGHPLIMAVGPEEEWIWCYGDNALLALDSAQLRKRGIVI